MAGRWYMNSIKLSKAYCEGFSVENGVSNPHPTGTPEHDAWGKGFFQVCPGDPDYYGGVDWHTGNYWCGPGGPGGN